MPLAPLGRVALPSGAPVRTACTSLNVTMPHGSSGPAAPGSFCTTAVVVLEAGLDEVAVVPAAVAPAPVLVVEPALAAGCAVPVDRGVEIAVVALVVVTSKAQPVSAASAVNETAMRCDRRVVRLRLDCIETPSRACVEHLLLKLADPTVDALAQSSASTSGWRSESRLAASFGAD